jgi:hypothetical protein
MYIYKNQNGGSKYGRRKRVSNSLFNEDYEGIG